MNLRLKNINVFNETQKSQFGLNTLPGHTSLTKFYQEQSNGQNDNKEIMEEIQKEIDEKENSGSLNSFAKDRENDMNFEYLLTKKTIQQTFIKSGQPNTVTKKQQKTKSKQELATPQQLFQNDGQSVISIFLKKNKPLTYEQNQINLSFSIIQENSFIEEDKQFMKQQQKLAMKKPSHSHNIQLKKENQKQENQDSEISEIYTENFENSSSSIQQQTTSAIKESINSATESKQNKSSILEEDIPESQSQIYEELPSSKSKIEENIEYQSSIQTSENKSKKNIALKSSLSEKNKFKNEGELNKSKKSVNFEKSQQQVEGQEANKKQIAFDQNQILEFLKQQQELFLQSQAQNQNQYQQQTVYQTKEMKTKYQNWAQEELEFRNLAKDVDNLMTNFNQQKDETVIKSIAKRNLAEDYKAVGISHWGMEKFKLELNQLLYMNQVHEKVDDLIKQTQDQQKLIDTVNNYDKKQPAAQQLGKQFGIIQENANLQGRLSQIENKQDLMYNALVDLQKILLNQQYQISPAVQAQLPQSPTKQQVQSTSILTNQQYSIFKDVEIEGLQKKIPQKEPFIKQSSEKQQILDKKKIIEQKQKEPTPQIQKPVKTEPKETQQTFQQSKPFQIKKKEPAIVSPQKPQIKPNQQETVKANALPVLPSIGQQNKYLDLPKVEEPAEQSKSSIKYETDFESESLISENILQDSNSKEYIEEKPKQNFDISLSESEKIDKEADSQSLSIEWQPILPAFTTQLTSPSQLQNSQISSSSNKSLSKSQLKIEAYAVDQISPYNVINNAQITKARKIDNELMISSSIQLGNKVDKTLNDIVNSIKIKKIKGKMASGNEKIIMNSIKQIIETLNKTQSNQETQPKRKFKSLQNFQKEPTIACTCELVNFIDDSKLSLLQPSQKCNLFTKEPESAQIDDRNLADAFNEQLNLILMKEINEARKKNITKSEDIVKFIIDKRFNSCLKLAKNSVLQTIKLQKTNKQEQDIEYFKQYTKEQILNSEQQFVENNQPSTMFFGNLMEFTKNKPGLNEEDEFAAQLIECQEQMHWDVNKKDLSNKIFEVIFKDTIAEVQKIAKIKKEEESQQKGKTKFK